MLEASSILSSGETFLLEQSLLNLFVSLAVDA